MQIINDTINTIAFTRSVTFNANAAPVNNINISTASIILIMFFMAFLLPFGASFLAGISVIPTVIYITLGVNWGVATFLGGTGLLIVVSVSLDLVQKIEAGLLMRSYEGFSSSGRIKGSQS